LTYHYSITSNTLYMKKTFSWGLYVSFASLLLSIVACQKNKDLPLTTEETTAAEQAGRVKPNKLDFIQVNLVANKSQYGARRIDTTLINGWGIAFSATGTPWINSQGGHVSEVYNSEGGPAIPAVHIPSPGGNEGGNPTGIIFNANAADFVIPSGNATPATGARFIFVGVDGILSAWNGSWGNHAFLKLNNSSRSAYTGLAIATNGGNSHLYAADFRARKIEVWDKTWNPVSMSFKDWLLPHGYSPYNIQNIGGLLYVTYAKVAADGRAERGVGKGYVSVFRPNGSLVKRFASRDKLNAPWGVALAPASFFGGSIEMDDDDNRGHGNGHGNTPTSAILVGNFGDGYINVYTEEGRYLGQLMNNHRKVEIEGLWAISFAPSTSTVDPNRLYFAAGPADERDGVFGYIIKDSTGRH
jgi:uncharacterized protein (TIGR03118 family)